MDNPLVTGIVVVAAASFSMSSHADFLGVYAGASAWNSAFTGDAQNGTTVIDLEDDLGTDTEMSAFYYLTLEHPVPVIPNIRVQHSDVSVTSTLDLDRTIDFDGTTYSAGESLTSIADLTHTDATLYYELVDLVAELDFGLTGRQFDGSLTLESDDDSSLEEIDGTIPMLYAKLGVKLPLTGLSLSVAANAIEYSDVSLYDATARLNYEAAFGLGVEAGYRVMELDIDDDDINAALTVDGAYVGLSYHF